MTSEPTVDQLRAELAGLKRERNDELARIHMWQQDKLAAIARVRAIHKPLVMPEGQRLMGSRPGVDYCEGCLPEDPFYAVEYPCETIRALDGEA